MKYYIIDILTSTKNIHTIINSGFRNYFNYCKDYNHSNSFSFFA